MEHSEQVLKERRSRYNRTFLEKHPESKRVYWLRRYHLTVEQFEQMVSEQNNKCAICEQQFVETPMIDHDHACCSSRYSCGRCIRRLLCRTCNSGLGAFKDNVGLLEKAIQYLKEATCHR